MKISLCMIVKDEERYIRQCLESALPLVDEAVIVDTGSTDGTLDILDKSFGDRVRVIRHEWKEDFSEARNKALENATGDWILVLDADEKISFERKELFDIMDKEGDSGLKIPFYNFFSNGMVEFAIGMIRLFKRRPGVCYAGAIHEQLTLNGERMKFKILDSKVCRIFHYGYLGKVMDDKDKIARNLSMIEEELKKAPDNPFNWYNMGIMEMVRKRYDPAIECFLESHKLCKGVRYNFVENIVVKLAECMLALNRHSACREYLENVLEDSVMKGIPDLHLSLGRAYKGLRMYEKAMRSFSKCIELGENSLSTVSMKGAGSFIPMIEWAGALVAQKKISEAVIKYMEAVFNKNNYAKAGLPELVSLLKQYNMTDVLTELGTYVDLKSVMPETGT
ncbi:glycosyl transferase family 2 [Anaerobacterium chartisolvens]|uniref:Glycosyl transferase family 2 n=1 Tax=Anaerobacterium chartisolvens TaxID=1297424 RepID=A0A369BMZ0_9FIRM|nr:glycosyltransferase [Anaerobacterium chartisolvens]RCX21044.1 glycosyl transferase family 2 [Anaerobacterium chartisolvens]